MGLFYVCPPTALQVVRTVLAVRAAAELPGAASCREAFDRRSLITLCLPASDFCPANTAAGCAHGAGGVTAGELACDVTDNLEPLL